MKCHENGFMQCTCDLMANKANVKSYIAFLTFMAYTSSNRSFERNRKKNNKKVDIKFYL